MLLPLLLLLSLVMVILVTPTPLELELELELGDGSAGWPPTPPFIVMQLPLTVLPDLGFSRVLSGVVCSISVSVLALCVSGSLMHTMGHDCSV